MPNTTQVALIVFLPLAGFILNGLFGRKYLKKFSGMLAVFCLAAAFILSLNVGYTYFFDYGKVNGVYQKFLAADLPWLQFGPSLSIHLGLLIDPLSVMMLFVVTFVSLMVHIYSLAYMKGEERYSTYYAFLGLFTFSMLGLVLSSNLFQMYICWELVGVSSFLLIGYYYDKPSAVAAAKKAFIVTRFADLGFLIGILVLSYYGQSLDFNTLITQLTNSHSAAFGSATAAEFLGISALTWGASLVFIGGAGKSAMFPLHIWLPDAMEGPTPVSALIHAATMVVAGVYLVARLFPIFIFGAPQALNLVAYTGAFSALFAAVIACTQTDIKRVLAYSTMSQIGYMIFALGVSGYEGEDGAGYTASLFHLFTHAMFKALLFLGAGAVIHFVHSNEMKDMGGLRKFLPVTHIVFLVACLAIAGIPPFAGFFSKEEILHAAWQHNRAIYWVAVFTSALTAFYMFRLYFSIFWGKENNSYHHHGEGGPAMMVPLVLLGIGAAAAGFIPFGHYVTATGEQLETPVDWAFSATPVILAVLAILLAMRYYLKENELPAKTAKAFGSFYRTVYDKFYIDEIYLFITKKIIFNCIGRPAAWIDANIVNGTVNWLGNSTKDISEEIKGVQSGRVQSYAGWFMAGTISLIVLFVYLWMD